MTRRDVPSLQAVVIAAGMAVLLAALIALILAGGAR